MPSSASTSPTRTSRGRTRAPSSTEYVSELALGEEREYLRPNFFVNTPDILSEYLQHGGRPAFEARLVLAATISPAYGVYSGFEHCENVPLHEGSEEYLHSEKYELKQRRLDGPLLPLLERLNCHPPRATRRCTSWRTSGSWTRRTTR